MGLHLDSLRAANVERLPQFKNGRGEPAHSEADGSDWALSAWSNAVLGEMGEAANIIKKIERGDFSLGEARADLAREFADVLTYLDLLAFRAGVDLGDATIAKFNEVSVRVGAPARLRAGLPSERIAEAAHEANRAYCAALGDVSQAPWSEAPDWQRQSAIEGVRFIAANPLSTPEDAHENWARQKLAEGWVYGDTKDAEAKTHPCLVPYDQLPIEQRAKDHIFRAIVLQLHAST